MGIYSSLFGVMSLTADDIQNISNILRIEKSCKIDMRMEKGATDNQTCSLSRDTCEI